MPSHSLDMVVKKKETNRSPVHIHTQHISLPQLHIPSLSMMFMVDLWTPKVTAESGAVRLINTSMVSNLSTYGSSVIAMGTVMVWSPAVEGTKVKVRNVAV